MLQHEGVEAGWAHNVRILLHYSGVLRAPALNNVQLLVGAIPNEVTVVAGFLNLRL